MADTALPLCGDETNKQYFVDDVNPQQVPKPNQPRSHRAVISVWSDLSVNDVDVLWPLTTADNIRMELARLFGLGDYAENEPNAALLDLYYYTVQFARENQFSKEQLSAFFSIVKKTHEVCVETPFGNVESCFQYFRDMLLCHAVKRPPFSIDVFSADDVRKISSYVVNTYFRHYKLYKYVFTPQVSLDLAIVYVGRPASPVQPPEAAEEVTTEVEETTTEAAEEQQSAEETPQEDDSAVSELRKLIREHLSEELKKLRVSVDEQIKMSEEGIVKRLQQAEASTTKDTSPSKGKKK